MALTQKAFEDDSLRQLEMNFAMKMFLSTREIEGVLNRVALFF